MKKTYVIAEIGTAHSGNLDKAFKLIDEAKRAGAHIIKFQWVYADEILHPDTGFVNLPGGSVRLYDRFRELEVPPSFFRVCLEYTHKNGLLFACSPFGVKSLHELCDIHPDAIKIASPEVNHIPLLRECASYYGKIPIILSSGVSKLGDIEKAIDILTGQADSTMRSTEDELPPLTLLHCITSYPAPEKEYNVRAVETLSKIFGIPTGISDHSLDPVLVPVLSSAMGGIMVEKHITLSKKTDGLDDPVALEEEEFYQMCSALRQTDALFNRYQKDIEASGNASSDNPALTQTLKQLAEQYGEEKVNAVLGTGRKLLAKSESANYGRTNRSLHYLREMKKGDAVKSGDISVLRTEKVLSPGIAPDYLDSLQGAVLTRDVNAGDGVQFQDFMSFIAK
ncbi:MAG: N-acetylneuraminate synthase family protein [Treponema sp.]|nr:N-acetylneuraminate synthase family protein [Treponema sp.]